MIVCTIFTDRPHLLFLVCLLVLFSQLCSGWQEETNHSAVNIIQLSPESLPIAEGSISGVVPFPVPVPSKQSHSIRVDSVEAHNDLDTWGESRRFNHSNGPQTPHWRVEKSCSGSYSGSYSGYSQAECGDVLFFPVTFTTVGSHKNTGSLVPFPLLALSNPNNRDQAYLLTMKPAGELQVLITPREHLKEEELLTITNIQLNEDYEALVAPPPDTNSKQNRRGLLFHYHDEDECIEYLRLKYPRARNLVRTINHRGEVIYIVMLPDGTMRQIRQQDLQEEMNSNASQYQRKSPLENIGEIKVREAPVEQSGNNPQGGEEKEDKPDEQESSESTESSCFDSASGANRVDSECRIKQQSLQKSKKLCKCDLRLRKVDSAVITNTGSLSLVDLPMEVLFQITKDLPLKELKKLGYMCRKLRSVAQQNPHVFLKCISEHYFGNNSDNDLKQVTAFGESLINTLFKDETLFRQLVEHKNLRKLLEACSFPEAWPIEKKHLLKCKTNPVYAVAVNRIMMLLGIIGFQHTKTITLSADFHEEPKTGFKVLYKELPDGRILCSVSSLDFPESQLSILNPFRGQSDSLQVFSEKISCIELMGDDTCLLGFDSQIIHWCLAKNCKIKEFDLSAFTPHILSFISGIHLLSTSKIVTIFRFDKESDGWIGLYDVYSNTMSWINERRLPGPFVVDLSDGKTLVVIGPQLLVYGAGGALEIPESPDLIQIKYSDISEIRYAGDFSFSDDDSILMQYRTLSNLKITSVTPLEKNRVVFIFCISLKYNGRFGTHFSFMTIWDEAKRTFSSKVRLHDDKADLIKLPNGYFLTLRWFWSKGKKGYSQIKIWNPDTLECLKTIGDFRGYPSILPNGLFLFERINRYHPTEMSEYELLDYENDQRIFFPCFDEQMQLYKITDNGMILQRTHYPKVKLWEVVRRNYSAPDRD